MLHTRFFLGALSLMVGAPIAYAQTPAAPATDTLNDPVRILVARLELERYKATVKGLTQFGDRRQGTDRNRAAVDWIEAQLKSYGCTNTERIKYDYQPPAGRGTGQRGEGAAAGEGQPAAGAAGGQRGRGTQGGGRPRGIRARTGVNNDPNLKPDETLRAL